MSELRLTGPYGTVFEPPHRLRVSPRPTVDDIMRVVCRFYKIDKNAMLSQNRQRHIARPRQIAMTLSRELTNRSLPYIGMVYGGRDHTTVLHAVRRIADLRKSDPELSMEYDVIKKLLKPQDVPLTELGA